MGEALASWRLLFLWWLVWIVRVFVTQTGGTAWVLALLQQVAQLCAVQRSPAHTPVKVIDSLTLDLKKKHNNNKHTHTCWKTWTQWTVEVKSLRWREHFYFNLSKHKIIALVTRTRCKMDCYSWHEYMIICWKGCFQPVKLSFIITIIYLSLFKK